MSWGNTETDISTNLTILMAYISTWPMVYAIIGILLVFECIVIRAGGQTMLYVIYITMPSVDLACYQLGREKDFGFWAS